MLTKYPDIVCSMAKEQDGELGEVAYLLYSKVLEHNAQIVLELGVGAGKSTKCILSAIEKTGGRLYSCDQTLYKNVIEEIRKLNFDTIWQYLVSNDLKFLDEWDKSMKADLIFIDTTHGYDHTLQELSLCSTIIKQGGEILLHDTKLHPDVLWAAIDFIRTHREFELNELGGHYGLGCIRKIK